MEKDRKRRLIRFVRNGDPDNLVVVRTIYELLGVETYRYLRNKSISREHFHTYNNVMAALEAGSMDVDEFMAVEVQV